MPDGIINVYDIFAPQLISMGLHPIPIGPGTKKPMILKNGGFVGLPLWSTRSPIRTPQPGAGLGVLMKNTAAVDIDDDKIGAMLIDALPDTPCRKIGQRGETLIYFAPGGTVPKRYVIGGRCVVEVLGIGTQTVLPPTTHPDIHAPYRWTGSRTLFDTQIRDLPQLPLDVYDRIEKILATFGWQPLRAKVHDTPHDADSDNLFRRINEAALANLPKWVPHLSLYGLVCRGENYEAVATWRPSTRDRPLEQRNPNLKISPQGIKDFGDGKTYTPIDLVIAAKGCDFKTAMQLLDEQLGWSAGPKIDIEPEAPQPEPQPGSAQDNSADQEGSKSGNTSAGSSSTGASSASGSLGKVFAKPFKAFDEATLERRSWLFAKHYQRGQVTATVGPGGAGKSSLDLVEAISMATGRNLLGEKPAKRYKIWIHNGDDDANEVKRRIAAVCRHYDIPMAELEGWLFATSKSDFTIKVANSGNGHLDVDKATVHDIITAITANEIDCAIFEPLVTLHAVPENDNVKMNAVVHVLGGIADGCNCAIEIAHHTRKLLPGSGDEYTSDDGRGASAIRDAVRGSRVLNLISKEEARKAGIAEHERLFYFRVDRGKANYLPPAINATWRKFENIELLNGDNVGVVTAWTFQQAQSALSDDAC